MSTHKHFDKLCCVVLALTLIISILFVNAEHFGVQKASTVMGYEKTLFDTSKVHTINIIMDDWDDFTANCKSEEYYSCSVVIDNEAYKNVAIRGKGNTSLSQVSNDRYSYKIEFDHYDNTNTYYGLDKLCLNNIIQDNTYMKDYLTYQMMNEMGVAAPLCSYVYITVNGEDWGLYLAVEGVEDSFLQRNYGKDYGELYKPDSMSFGGGRGNGKDFDINEFFGDSESGEIPDFDEQMPDWGFDNFPQPKGNTNGAFSPPQMPEGMTPPGGDGGNFWDNFPGGMTPPENENNNGEEEQNGRPGNIQDGFSGGDFMGGMSKGNDDVLLKYIDDNPDSYSNIFDNAKTDISDADKTRLISALKKLSIGENLTNTVDIDAVIRYFVVHNFVVNFDSYTGSMIHNYYLYEKDGQMQMIPWDYNLAFGGFMSMGSATSLVNYPIDSPVSGGDASDRPMIAWIFGNEEYTNRYHEIFSEFMTSYFESGYFAEMMDSVTALLAPYVEKDPTKFCTYEEFLTGISTLKQFCLLRAESVRGQLNGTIGATTETQYSGTLIDAGTININAMGSMGGSMDGGFDRPQFGSGFGDSNSTIPQMPNGDNQNGNRPNFGGGIPGGFGGGQMGKPDGNQANNSGQMPPSSNNGFISIPSVIAIIFSVLILIIGIIFAFAFKRRK